MRARIRESPLLQAKARIPACCIVGTEVARDVGKSLGGGMSGRVAGQIIRGTLGGVIKR